jgi:Mce-associated membrane protein
MAAIPAGAAGALTHPDSGPPQDDDERSIWERMADEPAGEQDPADAVPSARTEEPAAEEPVPEAPGPVAVLPGQEDTATTAAPAAAPETEPATAPAEKARKKKAPKAEKAPKPAKAEKTPGPGWKAYRWSIVAGVVVLALLAGVIVFGIQWFGQRAQDSESDAASGAARQMAVNLTSLNFNTVDAQVKQIIDETTGDFRNQFTQNADPFSNIVRVSKVETTSEVVGSGVQSIGDGKARVLVAVRSTVKNAQSPQGEVRNYRMAMDLQDQAGQWLTSNVEFVP